MAAQVLAVGSSVAQVSAAAPAGQSPVPDRSRGQERVPSRRIEGLAAACTGAAGLVPVSTAALGAMGLSKIEGLAASPAVGLAALTAGAA